MAKNRSIIKLRGTLGEMTFYEDGGVNVVKTRTSLNQPAGWQVVVKSKMILPLNVQEKTTKNLVVRLKLVKAFVWVLLLW